MLFYIGAISFAIFVILLIPCYINRKNDSSMNFFIGAIFALTIAICFIGMDYECQKSPDGKIHVENNGNVGFHYGWGYSVSKGKWGFGGGFVRGINF